MKEGKAEGGRDKWREGMGKGEGKGKENRREKVTEGRKRKKMGGKRLTWKRKGVGKRKEKTDGGGKKRKKRK